MKHSPYALKHCLVDVKGDKRACYATKEAAIFAVCIRGILEYLYKCDKTGMGYQHGSITFSHFTDRMIP